MTQQVTAGITECYSCRQEAAGESVALSERIVVTANWRIAHAFNTSLEGWLVLLPRRHVTAIDELSDAEAAELGPLLRRASAALRAETGCAKTYVIQFAEAAGFQHVHFHIVPRRSDLSEEHRGPRVFHYLKQPESEWVSAERRDELAEAIARHF